MKNHLALLIVSFLSILSFADTTAIPYKINVFIGTDTLNPFSYFEFHAPQLLPINYKNHSKAGITRFKGRLGYSVSYEQAHPHGRLSFSTGDQFLFTDPILEQRFVYPSASFFGATWYKLSLNQWFFDQDSYTLLQFDNFSWVSYFNQQSIHTNEQMKTLSVGGKLLITPLNMQVLAQAHSLSSNQYKHTYSGALIKVRYSPASLNLIQGLHIKPTLTYTKIKNSHQIPAFLPKNSHYTYSSFYSLFNDQFYSPSIDLMATKWLFVIDKQLSPYLKTASFSSEFIAGAGFLYQWRENTGFQVEAEHSSLEGGVGIWARCVLFDQLII